MEFVVDTIPMPSVDFFQDNLNHTHHCLLVVLVHNRLRESYATQLFRSPVLNYTIFMEVFGADGDDRAYRTTAIQLEHRKKNLQGATGNHFGAAG